MRRELRRLRNHSTIHVPNSKPSLSNPNRALPQKHTTIGPSKLGIRIRKMPPNIPQRGSAKKSIGNRMQQHIRIRMPQQAPLIRHRHPANNKRPPLYERVYVVPLSDSEIHSLKSGYQQ